MTEMSTDDFEWKVKYDQCLAGDNDSDNTSNGDQPMGKLYSIEIKITNSEKNWTMDQIFFFIEFE